MEPVQTRYARSGDVNIAYQVLGDGPFDVVLVPGFVSNVEYGWEEPRLAAFLRSLASYCRLIVFDKRGTGLSDRVRGAPTLETRMDDVRAILDAVGSERAALIGYSEGASMAALFATTYPARTIALVMYGSYLVWDWLAEGRFESRHESVHAALEEIERRWGTPAYCDELLENDAPSMLGDQEFRRRYATRLRLSASPRAAADLLRMTAETDTRGIVGAIRVPTLIIHRVGDRNVDVKNARYAAEHIPGARYVELPGNDHLPWVGDSDRIVNEIRSFTEAAWAAGKPSHPDRVLATVLFTDLIDSPQARSTTAESASRVSGPSRRMRAGLTLRSTSVEATPPGTWPPSTTAASSSCCVANAMSTSSASKVSGSSEILALVARRGPAVRMSWMASG